MESQLPSKSKTHIKMDFENLHAILNLEDFIIIIRETLFQQHFYNTFIINHKWQVVTSYY